MEESSDEKQQFVAFEKHAEFTKHLEEILLVDLTIEPSVEEERIEVSHLEKLITIVRSK